MMVDDTKFAKLVSTCVVKKLTIAMLSIVISGGVMAMEQRPYNSQSISAGRSVFIEYCASCHGQDGRANVNLIAAARDLTRPDEFVNGSSYQDLFNTISNGMGNEMPPFKGIVTDEDIGDVVNFLKSIGPADTGE